MTPPSEPKTQATAVRGERGPEIISCVGTGEPWKVLEQENGLDD